MSSGQIGFPNNVFGRPELHWQILGIGNPAGIYAPELGPLRAAKHVGGSASKEEETQACHRTEYIPTWTTFGPKLCLHRATMKPAIERSIRLQLWMPDP